MKTNNGVNSQKESKSVKRRIPFFLEKGQGEIKNKNKRKSHRSSMPLPVISLYSIRQ
jgi:hypothetical protein